MEQKSNARFSWIIGWLLAFSLCMLVLTATGSAQAVFSNPGSTMAVMIATLVLGQLFGFGAGKRVKVSDAKLNEMRQTMAAFFPTIVIESPDDERLAFDGRTAAIVEDQEESVDGDEGYDYQVKRYARSASGEYFWLILQIVDGKPSLLFAKHVEHNVARYALKEKYVPPPADGF